MGLHDETKVLLGSTKMSDRWVTQHAANPATFKAGLAVSRNSSDSLSLAVADGVRIGVSLGKSLSDTSETAVCRKGTKVPIKAGKWYGLVTITSYANLVSAGADEVTVGSVVFVAQSGAATPGDATFRAATSNDATATSLATQINAHEDLDGVVTATAVGAVVHIRAVDSGTVTIPLAYSDEGTATVGATVSGAALATVPSTKGTVVYIDPTTGETTYSTAASATTSNAVYAQSAKVTGVDEDGTEYECALIDMVGGL